MLNLDVQMVFVKFQFIGAGFFLSLDDFNGALNVLRA